MYRIISSSGVQSDGAVRKGGVPFSFEYFLIGWVESSLGVDEMVCLPNLGVIDRAKSLSGSIVTSSFYSSLVK